jgi:hydroxymethylpyrimidine pyrophosphatase-like HAD family hydrolase
LGPAGEPGLRRPRLVATDLDGTFLRSDGSVSERTRAVWAAADEAGIETVLVTARPPRWLHDLEHVVGPRGVAICGNGAFVYEVASRRLLETHCFDAGVVDSLVSDLRAALPSVTFAAERAVGPYLGPGFPDPHADTLADDAVHGPDEGIAAEPVGKLLALAPGVPTDELLATVASVVGDRGHLHFSGAFGLAEINAPGVTKAVALERWAARLGLAAADVWAFGDMPNDLPMIEWAGVGWAVANAHPSLLVAADRTCGSNDDDGVAEVLEGLLAPASDLRNPW